MNKCLNKITNMEYEYIKFDKYEKVKGFIHEHYNYTIVPMGENVEVYGLSSYLWKDVINKGDYVIRTTTKSPNYEIVPKKYFEKNFEV